MGPDRRAPDGRSGGLSGPELSGPAPGRESRVLRLLELAGAQGDGTSALHGPGTSPERDARPIAIGGAGAGAAYGRSPAGDAGTGRGRNRATAQGRSVDVAAGAVAGL